MALDTVAFDPVLALALELTDYGLATSTTTGSSISLG
jgi:hypothetical protein